MALDTASPVTDTVQPGVGPGQGPVRRWRVPAGRWWQPALVFVALVALWYGIAAVFASQGRGFLWPFPHEVLYAATAEQTALAQLYPALLNSALVALTGLVIAVVLGISAATLMVQARWIERSFFPYAVILQCIPILAVAPLIGVLFGYNFMGKVIVTVMISLFPMISNTLFGLQAADKAQLELFQLQGASRATTLLKLQFPAAMPSIFVGLRNAAGLSVIGAIVGDQLLGQGSPGLGMAISVFNSRIQGPETWAAILIASLFGIVVFLLFGLLRRLAVGKWFDLG
ncbi:MAG: NitT/TauT family transport system permease protein [Microbacteriaceae bacterium]|jgi:NitT/TauT family transport system permease protein|nr:NitT/TauT family transport system permease protein [Microbacteriaceae bacterium]